MLIMQKPAEYKKLFNYFKPYELGINLNFGHLNLASRAFGFSRNNFVKLLKNYIVAFEISHNNRVEDQHLPIKPNQWYLKILNDKKFINLKKILEFRNTSLKNIKSSIKILNNI